ncbi:MAG: glycosyltransferase family 2 protein [Pseudomonadota bacterium]
MTKSTALKTLPFVSVVLPTHNRADSLRGAIGSVLAQTYQDFELIVVDDGSTDETLTVLGQLSDERLQVISYAENRGANAARNIGIAAAKGTFIALQDSDDFWHAEKLKDQVAACQMSGAFVCFCAMQRLARGKNNLVPKKSHNLNQGVNVMLPKLLFGNFIGNPTLLIHKSCLHFDNFDEALPRLQDWELCLRLGSRYDFFFIDKALVKVGRGETQISSGLESYVKALTQIIDKHNNLFSECPSSASTVWLNAAAMCISAGQWKRGLRLAITQMTRNPIDALTGLTTLSIRALSR